MLAELVHNVDHERGPELSRRHITPSPAWKRRQTATHRSTGVRPCLGDGRCRAPEERREQIAKAIKWRRRCHSEASPDASKIDHETGP